MKEEERGKMEGRGRRPESEVISEAAHVSTPPWSSRRSAEGSVRFQ